MPDGYGQGIAKSVIAAFRETADAIVSRGRADIKSGGFTSRWQRGFTATVKPRQGNAATLASEISISVRHRMPFIAIFEDGGTIKGKPLLWIPLPGVPQKIGGRRMTPRLFVKEIGPLIRKKGRPPLLLGPARGIRNGRVGLAALRRGASGGGNMVPIFVGVASVTVHKRIHINEIVKAEADQIPGRYKALSS